MKSWFSRIAHKASAASPTALHTPAHDEVGDLIEQGQKLEDAGQVIEALALYRQALALSPRAVSGFINQGNALQLLGDFDAAIASYQQAIEHDAASASAWLNLGNALMNSPKPDQDTRKTMLAEAEAAYRAALNLRPDWAEACFGLGCVLEQSGALEEACAAYRRALVLDPAHDKAVFNLADLDAAQLVTSGEMSAARRVLLDGLVRHPGQPRLLLRLAELERDTGQLRASLKLFRQVLDATDATEFSPSTHTALLFTLNYLPEITGEDLFTAHQRFGQLAEKIARPLQPQVSADPYRRLRVGYVSPDFRRHPVANFIAPVLCCHDHSQVEVYCYYNHDGEDEVTARIRSLADHWRDIAKLSDDMVAKQIMGDDIDLLIDLTGHTSENSLMVFARRTAPVQITWLGYLGTTGLACMDYRLCDAYTDPPGLSEAVHTEQLLRLPDSQWCYERLETVPPPPPLPYLTNGVWTFGSYNNTLKLNEAVFAMWAAVLRAFPGSRMRVFDIKNNEMESWLRSHCTRLGITSERLICMRRTHLDAYFASAAEVDVALDSFPYSGGTTTCDNLLMGLPVASVAGTRTIARSGVSLLSTMGLQDWIAESPKTMPDLLRRQLAEPERVAALRAELPARMRASPLMDAPRFTKNLEALYREAWQRWCTSQHSGG